MGGLRRWMRRIERDAREDSIAIRLRDGTTEMFPMSESLLLEFLVSHWEAGMVEDAGEEYEWEGEIGRLHKALERATDESREEFYAQHTPFVAWEEEVAERNANEDAEEDR